VRLTFVSLFFSTLVLPQNQGLRVTVIEGQNAINDVQRQMVHEPVVEVQDAAGMPIQGAPVTFILPTTGPGGTFANGTNSLTLTTGRDGRAAARGIHLAPQAGKFEIRAVASYQGQTATAIITQTNTPGVSTSKSGGSKKIWIIAAIGAAAAAGGAIAATHGGSSSSSSSNAPIVITPGTPTVGGPH